MKKEILILRHAKSDWKTDFTEDCERPLNKRGKHDAQMIGHWMLQQQLLPDLVLCSPAVRASNTLEFVMANFENEKVDTEYPESLYLADNTTLLNLIHAIPDTKQRVLIVGHNPGLEELVQYISDQNVPSTTNNKLVTTANLVIFEIPGSYKELQQHGANLRSLIRPKEIKNNLYEDH